MEVAKVAEVVANVEDTPAILVSNVADVVALAFVSARTDTALIRVSNVAEVPALANDVPILAMLVAIVEDTAAIRLSSAADTLAILVAIVLETFAIDVCKATLVLDKVAETVLI